MKVSKLFFVTLISALSFMALGAAESRLLFAEDKGLTIAREADRRDEGFGDSEEIFTMTLINEHGNSLTRRMRVRTLERHNDGDWSLSIFDEPADIKGMALLTYSHGIDPDDQWLYMPALKRVKRIASNKKSGAFMGSEFSFEDFSSANDLRKYTYRYLRNEQFGGMDCFVSEWVPAYEHSGYKRMIVWHDTTEHRVQKIEYYNRGDKFFKTLLLKDYKQFLGKYWRSMRMEMQNHLENRSTILTYDKYRFRIGLTERDFDQNALKR